MKYMNIGKKPDTFYMKEATKSIVSDVPADLVVKVNNTTYHLHKFPLLVKCGLLQRMCSDSNTSSTAFPVMLHDIPGSEEAFELCVKFSYGIKISIGAPTFVHAFCAATFLQMTESVAQGNLVMKLESFFDAFILHGWKDSIVVLQSIGNIPEWPEIPRIMRSCIESVVSKILTHRSKVVWSFTYTRPGYSQKQHKSVPKDWWTEDASEISIDVFKMIISAVHSSKQVPLPLIGEALHVYACKNLPDPEDSREIGSSNTEEVVSRHKGILESIVGMIPTKEASVSCRFLLRLLKVAKLVGASQYTMVELVRRSGHQMDEATVTELILFLHSNSSSYDVGLVVAILQSFFAKFRMSLPRGENEQMSVSITRVAKIFDSYLQVIAGDPKLVVSKFIEIAQALPDIARQEHDNLYKAIDTYLKEHTEISKAERKQLCLLIDCRKLSLSLRSQAILNDRLPLRTIVHLLFVEKERMSATGICNTEQVQGKNKSTVESTMRSLSLSGSNSANNERKVEEEKCDTSTSKYKEKQAR